MSELAEALISENKKTKARFLDLGNCSLSHVPEELLSHHWLEELSFANEWWNWDDEYEYRERWTTENTEGLNNLRKLPAHFGRLKNLKKLWLEGDIHLPFQLSDIGPLSSLIQLQVLGLSCTRVTSVAPLQALKNLRVLDLWGAENLSDISPLATLEKLRAVDLWGTAINNVGALQELRELQFVNIAETGVTDLMPLVPMIERNIDVLNEPEDDSAGIFIRACPISRPPPEIVESGSEAILVFLNAAQEQGVDHLYEAKMLIVGEGGAGKTSLLRRLYSPHLSLPKENETTKGIHIHKHEFKIADGTKFRLNVWDFGGQEIYHATHQFFLTKRSLYILLDDTRRDSKTIHDEGFKYWLEVIDALSAHSPVLIFQNEKGGRLKVIDEAGIKGRFTNVIGTYGGDLSHLKSVEKVRAAIEYQVTQLPHVGEELPAKWLLIRTDIEKESQETHYISLKRYFEIYKKHLNFDSAKALHLSRYLHDLGVFLHFQDDTLLKRTIILQNDWATDAVFRMVDDSLVKTQFGRFTEDDCRRVWCDSKYEEMVPELLALMQKFELCYRLPDTALNTWLAPQLLSPSRSEILGDWERPDDLILKFRYEFLPKGIIGRLMVRQHRLVQRPELGWSGGVLFENSGNQLLAVVATAGSEIVLRSRGPERKELLSVIANDLDALNSTFHGVQERVQKQIPCICEKCKTSSTPDFYDHKRLLQRKTDGKNTVECQRSYLTVNVIEMLEGIQSRSRSSASIGVAKNRTKKKQSTKAAREIRIFLASSGELAEDRDGIDLYLRQLNDEYGLRQIYLKVVRWENLTTAVSSSRLQDEYNEEVMQADILLCLFSTKAGPGTVEEFEIGLSSAKATGRPAIYTYFKEEKILPSLAKKEELSSLWAFQSRLTELGHFWNPYPDLAHLKLSLRAQLELWIKKSL